jgi:hypothetical protein
MSATNAAMSRDSSQYLSAWTSTTATPLDTDPVERGIRTALPVSEAGSRRASTKRQTARMAAVPDPFPTTLSTAQRRSVLRRALANALRAGRHLRITAGDPPTTQPKSADWVTNAAIVALLWALGATLGQRLGAPLWSWPLLAVACMIVVGTAGKEAPSLAGVLLVLAILGSLFWQIQQDGDWLVTHAVPALAVVGLAVLTRRVDVRSARDVVVAGAALTRSAPLLAPLVLVVLLLPALTADLWTLAAELDGLRIGLLALLTIALLLGLVANSLRRQLPAVLAGRCRALAADARRAERTRRQMSEAMAKPSFEFADSASGRLVASAWPKDGSEYAPFIAATEAKTLSRPLAWRLGVCTAFVGLLLSAYIYALLTVLVSRHVAQAWTATEVPVRSIDIALTTLQLPGGVYLQVTALLGCLATATFLAFALLEERFAATLGDSLLKVPVDRLLVLALPYVALLELAIEEGGDLSPDFDIGAIDT